MFRKTIIASVLLVSLILAGIKVWSLDRIPVFFANDEIFYVAQARALAIDGKDMTGTWRSWYLTSAHPLYAELPGVFMAPAAALIQNPFIAGRITAWALSLLFAGGMAAVAWQSTKQRDIALLTLFVSLMNPWLFQYGRSGFDPIPALALFILAVYLSLRMKGWWQLLSLPFWMLCFYQYQAFKLLVLPMAAVVHLVANWEFFTTVLPQHFRQKKMSLSFLLRKKESLSLRVGVVLLVCLGLMYMLYSARVSTQLAAGRVKEFLPFDTQRITALANTSKSQSLDSPLTRLVTSKQAIMGQIFIQQYLASFDPIQMFLRSEVRRNPFALPESGFFMLIDLPLMLIGGYAIFSRKKTRPLGVFILAMILLAPIPNAVKAGGESWITFRSALLVPAGIFLSAAGAAWVWRKQRLVGAGVFLAYAGAFLLFAHMYFTKLPLQTTVDLSFGSRILSEYIRRAEQQPIHIYADQERFLFEQIMVNNGWITAATLPQIRETYAQAEAIKGTGFRFNTLQVSNACYNAAPGDAPQTSFVSSTTQPCTEAPKPSDDKSVVLELRTPLDNGLLYRVYGDTLCRERASLGFIHPTNQLIQLDRLTDTEFCEAFFVRSEH